MKKKYYFKPRFVVYTIKLRASVLTGSGGSDDHYIPVVSGQDEGSKGFGGSINWEINDDDEEDRL